jgi:tRNA-dependent cyclodipeptide synthase
MSDYKVRARGPSTWRSQKRACLAISVGSQAHEGNKLEAVVSWIAANFDECIVDLSDTLQRWNLLDVPGVSMDEAMAAAMLAGDDWLERNRATLDRLPPGSTVIRWNHWLTHPDYESTRAAFGDLYRFDHVFRDALDRDASIFVVRHNAAELKPAQLQVMLENSREFILEEISAHTLLGRDYPSAKVYPGRSLEALQIVRDRRIQHAPSGLENERYVRVTLDRVNQPLMQPAA